MQTKIPNIDISQEQWHIVSDILKKYVPQYEVWAFGSRAKWSAKKYSDLDLAIISDNGLSLATLADLREDFSESDLPWPVDLIDWSNISDSFKQIIENDKVVVQQIPAKK